MELRRNIKKSLAGGVCAGIGDFFHVDHMLVRIIFMILISDLSGWAYVYLFLWAMLPADDVT